jgi:uncharacterized protein YgfB (UPF0149 family)
VNQTFDYDTVNDALQRLDLDVDAAHVHGLTTGLICGDFTASLHSLIQELLTGYDEQDQLVQECRRILTQLHGVTKEQLDDIELGFYLLLPDGEESLPLRAKAVTDWCQGFLFGYGINIGDQHGRLARDSLNALEDIGQFTRMDTSELDEMTEDDQQSLQHIEEYLRMAALMIYADCVGVSDPFAEQERAQ